MKNLIFYTTLVGFLGEASAADFEQKELDEAIALSLASESEEVVRSLAQDFEYDWNDALVASLESYENEKQIKNDEVIAKILAEEIPYADDDRRDSDEQFARSLDAQLNKGPAIKFPSLKRALAEPDRQAFVAITEAFKKIPFDMDVHHMIRDFAQPHYAGITQLELQYLGLTPTFSLLPFNQIKGAIISFLDDYKAKHQADSKNVSTLIHREKSIIEALNLIEGYYKNPVDSETKVDLRKIFSDTYQMAVRYSPEYMALLCEKLAENKETSGGCHPGITGRLIGFYYKMVADAISAHLR